MDMADAVNIMLYATPPVGEGIPEEHQAGVAAWDIFRAEDADKIRQFLREEKENNATNRDDPIHTQLYFIDAPMRIKLWSKYGVKGWRIYQKAGEAVFIPAGCAHQVCNLGDCIKVAVDFISPENVSRCFRLTSEFRELTHESKAWKQDVLSLRTTLWYAWCAYRQMEGAGPDVQLDKAEKSRSSVQAKMIRQQEGESAEMRPQHPKVTQLRRSAHKATSKKMITDDALDDEELKLPTRRKRNAPEDDLETPSNAAKRDKATPSKTKQKSISPR